MTSPHPAASRRSPRVALHYWGRRGAGSHFTLYLARHLADGDPGATIVLSLSQGNVDMEAFEASGFSIMRLDRPGLATLWRDGWALPGRLKAHASELAALDLDAVVMTMNSPFAWPFIRALQRRGVRVFYVAHDAEPHPGDYARLWQRVTQDLLVKSADGVVALSGTVAKRLAERVPACRERISTIPLEVVYPVHRTALPDWNPAEEPIRLLSYGRLLPYKGLDLLAEALEPLRASPNWRLTLAGSGPLAAEVERLFGEWPQVSLELGWVSEDRAAELLASHHLLLCPYTEASQSGAIAQALSWAMPSLVMPTGALPEQVGFGTAGLVAQTMDAAGFRQALQTVLDNPRLLVDLSHGASALLAERRTSRAWTRLITRAGIDR